MNKRRKKQSIPDPPNLSKAPDESSIPSNSQSKFDKLLFKIKDHLALAVLLLVFGAVIYVGKVTDSFDIILPYFEKFFAEPATTSANTQIDDSDPVYISHSVEQIAEMFNDQTSLQGEEQAKRRYVGKWMKIQLVVEEVRIVGHEIFVEGRESGKNATGPYVRAIFSAEAKSRLNHLGRGDTVLIDGEITGVVLEDKVVVVLEEPAIDY